MALRTAIRAGLRLPWVLLLWWVSACRPPTPGASPADRIVGELRAAVRAEDEDRVTAATDVCARRLTTDQLLAELTRLRSHGDFAYASPNMFVEDALLTALMDQGDAAVTELFAAAEERGELVQPAARMLYTMWRDGRDMADVSTYLRADTALGRALREAERKAGRFRRTVPRVRLPQVQAVFDGMLPARPLKRASGEPLPWAGSPYNSTNWRVVPAASSARGDHPLRLAVDRRVTTFWAGAAGDARPGFRIVFPQEILLEHEVSYGIVVLPGARSSAGAFEDWGRPTRIRLGFSDGVTKTFDVDYENGRPRGRVDLYRQGAGGPETVLMQSAGAALIAKPRLRWRRWTSYLEVVVLDWDPGRRFAQPALSEIAIDPPPELPARRRPGPLRLDAP